MAKPNLTIRRYPLAHTIWPAVTKSLQANIKFDVRLMQGARLRRQESENSTHGDYLFFNFIPACWVWKPCQHATNRRGIC